MLEAYPYPNQKISAKPWPIRHAARWKWTWRLAELVPRCLPRAGLLSNHDVDIEIDGRQQLQQPLKGEAGQPVLAKRREAGLRDAKRLGNRGRRGLRSSNT